MPLSCAAHDRRGLHIHDAERAAMTHVSFTSHGNRDSKVLSHPRSNDFSRSERIPLKRKTKRLKSLLRGPTNYVGQQTTWPTNYVADQTTWANQTTWPTKLRGPTQLRG